MFVYYCCLLFSFGTICLSTATLFIDPTVAQLQSKNFYNISGIPTKQGKQTLNSTQNWFIIFYSPKCPHCRRTMPIWNDLATELSKQPLPKATRIGSVNCIIQRALCQQFKVHGYPTIVFIDMKNTNSVFHGKRSVQDFRKFILQKQNEVKSPISNQTQVSELINSKVNQSQNQLINTQVKNIQKQISLQSPQTQSISIPNSSNIAMQNQISTNKNQTEQNKTFIKSFRKFFQQLTYVGLFLIVFITVLISILIYILFDRQQQGKQFTQVQEESKELSQL